MAEFNTMAPPIKITNPKANGVDHGKVYQEFPRHLHKADGSYVEVTNDIEKAAKLAQGYHLTPDAAKAAAAVPAADDLVTEAPARRKPGRPRADDAAA